MIFSARRHSSTRSSAPFTHPEVTHPEAGHVVPTDGVTGEHDEEAAAGPRIYTVLVADDAFVARLIASPEHLAVHGDGETAVPGLICPVLSLG